MSRGLVKALYICPNAGEPMQDILQVRALAGRGLEGDRYSVGKGSYNKEEVGKRQVTLINGLFFEGTPFDYPDSRRNIVTDGVELMWLIGREFRVGEALLLGVKYCDPCQRPNLLAGKKANFKEVFFDRGGLVADILEGGLICVGDTIIPPPKGY